jgi:hypothetical protein
MANTLKRIQTVTVGSGGAATIDFTSIPQSYTDLKIVLSARSSESAPGIWDSTKMNFNSTTTGYSNRYIDGTGASVSSGSDALGAGISWSGDIPDSQVTASVFGNIEIDIPNYTSANNKSYSSNAVMENNGTTVAMAMIAGLWSNTAAITSISFSLTTGNFVQYSTATLYGVANVPASNSAYATGGNQIYTDNTYWYHIFTSSGTFTPIKPLTCDYLVVAGGGGGGWTLATNSYAGGGGGAGGLRSTVGTTGGGGSLESALSVDANTGYTVTVGAGGATTTTSAASGNNSVFATITSTGGGAGARGTLVAQNGSTGGSGGASSNGGTAGTGTGNQGFAGASSGTASGAAGGGGGAGGVGSVEPSATGGAGGIGVANSITGISVSRAGGGGGGGYSVGPGGAGTSGGGTGGTSGSPNGVAGTANTGGGGGGAQGAGGGAGGAGGAGIVIVRYAV